MARFGGRSRGGGGSGGAKSKDPPGDYNDERPQHEQPRIPPPAFYSGATTINDDAGASTSNTNNNMSRQPPPPSSQKSMNMTSGISTLFRRQPSPDVPMQNYYYNHSTPPLDTMTIPPKIQSNPVSSSSSLAAYTPAQLLLLHGTGNPPRNNNNNNIVSSSAAAKMRRTPPNDSYLVRDDRPSVSFDNNNLAIPSNITSSDSDNNHDQYDEEEDDDDDDDEMEDYTNHHRQQPTNTSQTTPASKSRTTTKSAAPTSSKKKNHNTTNMPSSSSSSLRLPRRYRGFSTSISSLFLDESIVCGALSCCGLLLSSRTEHLLDERNVKRGLTRRGVGGEVGRGKEGGRRSPSRIVGVAWIFTTFGVLATYAIWGFDSTTNDDYYDEYDYDYSYYDDGDFNDNMNGVNNNRRLVKHENTSTSSSSSMNFLYKKHGFSGIMKMRDYREHIFEPVVDGTKEAYTTLMAQFDADEYHPHPFANYHRRYLEDYSSSSAATNNNNINTNSSYEQGQQVRAIMIVLFLLLLGIIGRRRRMRTRFAILRARAQDDHLYYASILTKKNGTSSGSLATPDNTIMENFHEREDNYDGACSHTLLGCYPVDKILPDYVDDTEHDDDPTNNSTAGFTKRGRKGGDFMGRTTTMLLTCCCGKLCNCWCQIFSSCALAQEARETRLLLPPSMQRVDLMTHQPFHEYAKDVNNLRMRFMEKSNRTWLQHYSALSHLSRYILLGFILIMVFVLTTLLSHPTGRFGWGDAVVLIATFSQSFLVLFIVFGIFHRSDLSFDAVIKFFAVGFCISVSVGFISEAILINSLLSIMYFLYYLLDWSIGEDFEDWMTSNYRYVSIFSELINAYFVAALVEELCKYYGFRFVEHPDLLFLTGLDRTAKQAKSSGGLDSYKYDSQLISNFSSDHGCDSESLDSRGRKKMSKMKLNRNLSLDDDDDEIEPELRTLQQQAAAITTGMISVAVGLACAENCLYVFLLGGAGGSVMDMSVRLCILLFRSIFPIHALGAAMQSINMIRKFIEEKHGGERNIGVGRIIFPAVLLHGTFDAILMSVNAYIEASYESYYENGGGYDDDQVPFNAIAVNLIACLGIVGVMAVSFGWYSHQNKMQMLRLAMFDMNRGGSGYGSFHAPSIV